MKTNILEWLNENPPPDEGSYVLGSVDGELQWIESAEV
jgi:hypothetical protein